MAKPINARAVVAARVLRHSEEGVHFLFGSLLSAYAVFYFKSASGLMPLVFLAALCAVLVANELPRFRKLGLPLRTVERHHVVEARRIERRLGPIDVVECRHQAHGTFVGANRREAMIGGT